MDKVSGIYRILCRANGRYYYGSATNIARRWKEHQNALRQQTHKNPIVQNSWNKHGENSFVIELVEHIEPKKLLEVEDMYLTAHVGKPNCMNIAKNATASMLGRKHTAVSRQKMSNSQKEERNHFFGKHHSKETRDVISTAQKGSNNSRYGKYVSKETKLKMRESHIGKHQSKETKQKISKAKIGRRRSPFSQAWKDKLSKTHTGKRLLEETKQKISDSLRNHFRRERNE